MEKGSSSSTKKKGKKKVPKLDAKPKKQKPKAGNGKPKGKCYTCGQKGHYKNNCPKKSQSHNGNNNSGMPQSYVVESYFMARTTGTWCVDTRATNHVCNTLQGSKKLDG